MGTTINEFDAKAFGIVSFDAMARSRYVGGLRTMKKINWENNKKIFLIN
jgi:hypothetical protein